MSNDADTSTLVIAVLGLVLSVASLAWQAVTYRLNGPRIRVAMRVGASNGTGYGTAPVKANWQRGVQQLQEQGLHTAIVAVLVRNVGRQATTVVRYEAILDTGMAWGLTGAPPGCPPLPHRLEAESQVLYYLPLQDCINMAYATAGSEKTKARHLQMKVELGSGKVLTAKERLPAPDLVALAGK